MTAMVGTGDHHHERAAHLLWGGCAAVVLAYIFLAALGAFEPEEVLPLTVAVVVIAGLWLAHEWRELWREEHRDHGQTGSFSHR